MAVFGHLTTKVNESISKHLSKFKLFINVHFVLDYIFFSCINFLKVKHGKLGRIRTLQYFFIRNCKFDKITRGTINECHILFK